MCIYAENGATLLVGTCMVTRKKTLVEWKALFDTVMVKRADLKDKIQFLLFLKK